jgi:hypothetical protein
VNSFPSAALGEGIHERYGWPADMLFYDCKFVYKLQRSYLESIPDLDILIIKKIALKKMLCVCLDSGSISLDQG